MSDSPHPSQFRLNPSSALRLGAILGGLAVALGAFGAHGLKGRVDAGSLDPKFLEVFKTGVQYHFYHALAIFGLAAAGGGLWSSRWIRLAVLAWTVGIALFSGSLYAMTLTQQTWLGAITPLGGVAFIAGWIFAAWGAGKPR